MKDVVRRHRSRTPFTRNDDRIRVEAARAIYGAPALNRYVLDPAKPIRITVVSGNITLTGVVASQSDKDIAGIRANGVPGAFKVTNNLQVATTRCRFTLTARTVQAAGRHGYTGTMTAHTGAWHSTRITLEMIKVGTLDFCVALCASTGAVLAAGGWPRPSPSSAGLSSAWSAHAPRPWPSIASPMQTSTAANPRTAMRAIPAGTLTRGFATVFILVSCAVFVLGAAMLNRLNAAARLRSLCWSSWRTAI